MKLSVTVLQIETNDLSRSNTKQYDPITQEIRSLSADELLALRRAMSELQRRNGSGSFIYNKR